MGDQTEARIQKSGDRIKPGRSGFSRERCGGNQESAFGLRKEKQKCDVGRDRRQESEGRSD